jgi:hypothetical protein
MIYSTRPFVINTLRLWFMNMCNKLERLSVVDLSGLVQCLWLMPGAYPGVEHLKDASIRQLLFLPANIRLGRKALARTNTLAYYKNL